MRIPETHAPPEHHGPTALVVVSGDDVFEDLFTAAAELHAPLTDEGLVTRTGMGRFDRGSGARRAQPPVRVSEFGKGCAPCVRLGHAMRIWAEPVVRLLIRRAARWVNRLEVQGVAS